jgi:hypothetical protein
VLWIRIRNGSDPHHFAGLDPIGIEGMPIRIGIEGMPIRIGINSKHMYFLLFFQKISMSFSKYLKL